MAQINEFATLFQQAGFETYYVNSVDVYRSFNERYVRANRQLNAGFALVSGGRVYTRENSQTRQRIHYVLNAARIIPGLSAPIPNVGGMSDVVADEVDVSAGAAAEAPAPPDPFEFADTRSLGDEPLDDAALRARFDRAASFVTARTGVTRDADLESSLTQALAGGEE